MAKRIIYFNPNSHWRLDALCDMTLARAMRARGAEVHYVVCDRLFTECDAYREAIEPRPANACTVCQAEVTQIAVELEMELVWLGRYVRIEETREALRWADSLRPEELEHAVYGDWQVSEWVMSSVRTHLRASQLDLSDEHVVRTARSYVYGGLVACFALDRLIRETAPDAIVVFNGRMSATRVALELGRRQGVRVLSREWAHRKETVTLFENVTCLSLAPYRDYWRDWGDTPLSYAELDELMTFLDEREHGRGQRYHAFASAPESSGDVIERLGLDPERPIWVAFTSSDDEVTGSPDHASPFPTQLEWLRSTVRYVEAHPELQLVIRVHPNTGSQHSIGRNKTQLTEMQRLRAELPANAIIIEPDDDLSSYALMNVCAAGLVWASTVGLELACKGKLVVSGAGSYVAGMPFARTVRSVEGYPGLLDELLELPPQAISRDVARAALRLAYGIFVRIRVPFPLIQMPAPWEGHLTDASIDALAPGRCEGLDRCMRIILEGEPICLPPTPAERDRTVRAEDYFLTALGRGTAEVLTYAAELITDPALLKCWRTTYGDRKDVKLLIEAVDAQVPALVELVKAAGLDGEATATLVAGTFTLPEDASNAPPGAMPANPVAVLSRHGGDWRFPDAPSFEDAGMLGQSSVLPA